jgi:hypothetical protein
VLLRNEIEEKLRRIREVKEAAKKAAYVAV